MITRLMKELLKIKQLPLTSKNDEKYDAELVAKKEMGPNAIFLENLSKVTNVTPGMKIF